MNSLRKIEFFCDLWTLNGVFGQEESKRDPVHFICLKDSCFLVCFVLPLVRDTCLFLSFVKDGNQEARLLRKGFGTHDPCRTFGFACCFCCLCLFCSFFLPCLCRALNCLLFWQDKHWTARWFEGAGAVKMWRRVGRISAAAVLTRPLCVKRTFKHRLLEQSSLTEPHLMLFFEKTTRGSGVVFFVVLGAVRKAFSFLVLSFL